MDGLTSRPRAEKRRCSGCVMTHGTSRASRPCEARVRLTRHSPRHRRGMLLASVHVARRCPGGDFSKRAQGGLGVGRSSAATDRQEVKRRSAASRRGCVRAPPSESGTGRRWWRGRQQYRRRAQALRRHLGRHSATCSSTSIPVTRRARTDAKDGGRQAEWRTADGFSTRSETCRTR